MAKFLYNNGNNASISHTPFELNYGYHLWISHKEEVDLRSKSKLENKLSAELKKLIIVYRENLYYPQKLQKQAHSRGTKSWSYDFDKKVWLNSKYIKT